LTEERDLYGSKVKDLEQEMTQKMSNVKILEAELEEKLKKMGKDDKKTED
jgi:hypothetical protein